MYVESCLWTFFYPLRHNAHISIAAMHMHMQHRARAAGTQRTRTRLFAAGFAVFSR